MAPSHTNRTPTDTWYMGAPGGLSVRLRENWGRPHGMDQQTRTSVQASLNTLNVSEPETPGVDLGRREKMKGTQGVSLFCGEEPICITPVFRWEKGIRCQRGVCGVARPTGTSGEDEPSGSNVRGSWVNQDD